MRFPKTANRLDSFLDEYKKKYGTKAFSIEHYDWHLKAKKHLDLTKKYKGAKYNILLHAPLHPSVWIYLMDLFPEHNWFVEPKLDFEEGKIPFEHLKNVKYISLSKAVKLREKFDIQIICLHLPSQSLKRIIETFSNIPIVWIEYWKTTDEILPLLGGYPLISTCKCKKRNNYFNTHFSYIIPSKNLWKESWIGDKKEIFCPIHPRFWRQSPQLREIIEYLKTKIPLKIIRKEKRDIPFQQWKNYFIHSRALLELEQKFSSGILAEAMFIGMPVVTSDDYDYKFFIQRNKIDGFRSNSKEKLLFFLKKLLEDDLFAKKMGKNAKKRAEIIFNEEKHRKFWNNIFKEAILLKKDLKIINCPENFRACIHCGQCNHITSSRCRKCGKHPRKYSRR